MLVRLLYSSRSIGAPTATLLDEILAQSRRNNPEKGVTGLLCVSGETFIQVLEGGRDEVCDLYNAIVRDQRHANVRLLVYEEISERRFGAWTMGQVQATRINPALLLKYYRRARLEPNDSPGTATMALLHELVATAAILGRSDG
jgi:Sensors of blue-light using FAD